MANFVKDIQKEFGTMKLEQLHPNEGQIKGVPRNPRTITEEEFKKLKKSLKNFRKMLYLRPMVVDEDYNILGGNMRYRALVKLAEEHAKIGAYEFTDDIPDEWVKQDCTLTEKEKREFVLKDNKERGETDWDIIANEWDTMELQEWDMEIPIGAGELDNEGNYSSEQNTEYEQAQILDVEDEYIIVTCKPEEFDEVRKHFGLGFIRPIEKGKNYKDERVKARVVKWSDYVNRNTEQE